MSDDAGSNALISAVKSSALPNAAPAQATNHINAVPSGPLPDEHSANQTQTDRIMPLGLKSLYNACTKVYPEQPNPLQVTTRLKYWLGGQDPLDYISMYWNPGRPDENIPPHWHYVSFGMSDLHGDGRVHPEPGTSDCSGYGLELTFRLAAEGRDPPLWPATLLQALARYVFTTGNKFCAGDHISWHAPLDGAKSRIRHLLVADDQQLNTVETPHGVVSFIQMVGCTNRELRAAQRGSGFEVLANIAEDPGCGGSWLVTRVNRSSARGVRGCGGGRGGGASELAGVSARASWRRYAPSAEEVARLSPSVERQIKETLQRGLSSMSERGAEGHNMSTDSFEMSSIERALPQLESMQMSTSSSWRGEDLEYYDGVQLMLNAEGASLLPLAIDGRVLHSRHFTWRQGPRAVTILPPTVAGAFVTPEKPYASRGSWLQVLIPKELALDISKQVQKLYQLGGTDSESEEDVAPPTLPITMSWPRHKLQICVLHDLEIL